MDQNQENISKSLEKLCENTLLFLQRGVSLFAMYHVEALLISAAKKNETGVSYLDIDQLKKILELVNEASGELLTFGKTGDVCNYYRQASAIAAQCGLIDLQSDFEGKLGDLLTSQLSDPHSKNREEAIPVYREALTNYHSALRLKYISDSWGSVSLLPNVKRISQLESRYYYNIAKELVVDQLTHAKKTGKIQEQELELFTIVDFIGRKLTANLLASNAWDLYASTHEFVTSDIDVIYLERFVEISNALYSPPLEKTIDEIKESFSEKPPIHKLLERMPYNSDWIYYKKILAECREEFTEVNSENASLAQEKYAERLKRLIHTILQDCFSILGPAPCKFCLLSLGSIANRNPTPYSDLEFGFIMEDTSNFSMTDKSYISQYFEKLLQLFEFKVNSIGEFSPAGFHLDKEGHPGCEDRLKGTPKEMVAKTQPKFANSIVDALSFSVYHAGLLFGDKGLFSSFDKLRRELLLSAVGEGGLSRKVAGAFLEFHVKEFSSLSDDFSESFDIKKRFHIHLNYLVLDLALYADIVDSDYNFTFQDALKRLKEKKLLSDEFAACIEKAFNIVQAIRIRIQQVKEQQYETVCYPNGAGTLLTETEFSQLKGIYFGVLKPLCWAVQYLLDQKEWFNSPSEAMYRKNCEYINDEARQFDKEAFRDAVRSRVSNLVFLQKEPEVFYYHLTLLPDVHYSYFYSQVMQAEREMNGDEERLKHIMVNLRYYPKEDGRREQVEINTKEWFKSLEQLVSKKPPYNVTPVYVESMSELSKVSMVEGYLSGDVQRQISKVRTDFFKDDFGTVCEIECEGKKYYLKKNSHAPGREFATVLFDMLFIGCDVVRCELFKFTVEEKSFPVMVVGGELNQLQAISSFSDAVTDKLDEKSFTHRFISLLLTHPNDSSPLNCNLYQFTNIHGEQKHAFVSLFHDNYFARAIDNIIQKDSNGDRTLDFKITSLMFFQQAMVRSISEEARKAFCVIEPGRTLCNWLFELKAQYMNYFNRLGKKDGKDMERWVGGDDVFGQTELFSKGFLEKLYAKIVLVQRCLRDYRNITHAELLLHVEPVWAYYYFVYLKKQYAAFNDVPNVARFFEIRQQPFSFNETELVRYIRQQCKLFLPVLGDVLDFELRETVKQKPNIAFIELEFIQQDGRIILDAIKQTQDGVFEKYKQLKLPASRGQVLKEIDFSRYNRTQYKIFIAANKIEHTRLSLVGLSHLKDSDLADILKKSPNLLELKIQGCTGLTSESMLTIAKFCHRLRKLDISSINSWTNVCGKDIGDYVTFDHLRELNLNHCEKLKGILINAPGLQLLQANHCKALEHIQTFSTSLVQVYVNFCSSLTSDVLVKLLMLSASTLNELELSNCPTIDNTQLREKYLCLNFTRKLPEKLSTVLNHPEHRLIDLSECDLDKHHLQALLTFFENARPRVDGLNLSGVRFTYTAEQLMVDLIIKYTEIKGLRLRNIKLQGTYYVFVSKILNNSFSLVSLDLSNNQLDDDFIKQIAPCFDVNRSLGELYLSDNNISDSGFRRLTHYLLTIKLFLKLTIANNQIGLDGFRYFCDKLAENKTLLSISMEDNPCFDEIKQFEPYLNKVLMSNKILQECKMLKTIFKGIKNQEVGQDQEKQASKSGSNFRQSKRYTSNYKVVSEETIVLEEMKAYATIQNKINDLLQCNIAEYGKLIAFSCTGMLSQVRTLCEQGLRPNGANNLGQTAFHEAVLSGNREMVEYFISLQPNLFMPNERGQTVKELAPSDEVKDLLKEYQKILKTKQKDKEESYRKEWLNSPKLIFFKLAQDSPFRNLSLELSEEERDINDKDHPYFDFLATYQAVAVEVEEPVRVWDMIEEINGDSNTMGLKG